MSRVIEGGAAFRLRPAMKMLRDAIDLTGGNADASDMADMAFGLAKGAWEKENQRPLPYAHWPVLRVQAVLGLAQVLASSAPSGRRNPGESWTGTEKQIAWAKAIRAEAEPVIRGWIKEYENSDYADHLHRLQRIAKGRSTGGNIYFFRGAIREMKRGLAITDARFWIDLRSCADAATFVKRVEAHRP